jgi:hypothetical protein
MYFAAINNGKLERKKPLQISLMTAKLKFTNLSENAIIFFRYVTRLPREY